MRAAIVAILSLVVGVARAEAPHIKPTEIVDTVDAAIAAADAKTPSGQGLIVAWIEKADVPIVAKAVREALAKTSLTIIEDFTQGSTAVITVEAQSDARATIVVDTSQGSITLTGHPTSTKAPGKCVKIPNRSHEVYLQSMAILYDGEIGRGTTHWKLETARLLDIDGDGSLDAFVPIAKSKHDCPEDVSWRVCAVRGGCGHDLGVVGPGFTGLLAAETPLDASGFRPLVYSAESTGHGNGPIPEMRTIVRTFAVKKGRYAKQSQTESSGRCHHCATWSCHAVK